MWPSGEQQIKPFEHKQQKACAHCTSWSLEAVTVQPELPPSTPSSFSAAAAPGLPSVQTAFHPQQFLTGQKG